MTEPGDATPPPPEEPTPPVEGAESAAPDPDPTPRCEVCGTELDADQTYCLECGAPTPLAPALRRRGRDLALLAGALAILGIGAGALAFAVAADDGDDRPAATGVTLTATATAPATATATVPTTPPPIATVPTIGTLPADTSVTTPPPPGTTATVTGFQTVTGPTTAPDPGTTTAAPTTEETTGEVTEPPDADPEPTADSDWPSGRTAWTAILSSVRDESDARAARTRVRASGEPAGVLFSSDHTELQPGFWVVFSGTFASRSTAIAQAGRMRPSFPGAYAREISG